MTTIPDVQTKLRSLVIRRTYETHNPPDLEAFEESLGIKWIQQEHEPDFGVIQMAGNSSSSITVTWPPSAPGKGGV